MLDKDRDQNGAAALEFVFVLPILILFLFGIIEFGLLFYNKSVITNASREGARVGILHVRDPKLIDKNADDVDPLPKNAVYDAVNQYCSDYLISFGTSPPLSINIDPSDQEYLCNNDEEYVTVTIQYPYHFLMFPDIVAFFFKNKPGFVDGEGNLTIPAQTVMRCQ